MVSVLSSLVVALTVTPALCYYLLGSRQNTVEYGGKLVLLIKDYVERAIRLSTSHPIELLAVVLSVTIACAVVFFNRGSSFLPEFNEGSYQVNLIVDPDASLDTSDAFGKRLERVLTEIDGIQHVGRRTGRAPGDEHAMPVGVSEAIVTVDSESTRSREDLLREIRDQLQEEFPGVINSTEHPLKHLLDHLLSGVTASVAIKIRGQNLDVLRETAAEVEAAIQTVPGVRDLYG